MLRGKAMEAPTRLQSVKKLIGLPSGVASLMHRVLIDLATGRTGLASARCCCQLRTSPTRPVAATASAIRRGRRSSTAAFSTYTVIMRLCLSFFFCPPALPLSLISIPSLLVPVRLLGCLSFRISHANFIPRF